MAMCDVLCNDVPVEMCCNHNQNNPFYGDRRSLLLPPKSADQLDCSATRQCNRAAGGDGPSKRV
jgi:hypothetical protein